MDRADWPESCFSREHPHEVIMPSWELKQHICRSGTMDGTAYAVHDACFSPVTRWISAARSVAFRVTKFACCSCGGSGWPSAAIAKLKNRIVMIPNFIVTSLLVKDFEHVIARFLAVHY